MDWRCRKLAAEAKPDQVGRAMVRREMKRAMQTQNMARSIQTEVSERPEGKQRLSTLAHGSSYTCLPTPFSCRMMPRMVILVTRSTPGRGGGGDTRDP